VEELSLALNQAMNQAMNQAYPIHPSPFILIDIRFAQAYHKQHSEKNGENEIG
jgi:hypothetical protein